MTTRITERDLQILCEKINDAAGCSRFPYVDGAPQAGHYHIAMAYGGVNLHRFDLKQGSTAETKPLGGGFMTKRELYMRMEEHLNDVNWASEMAQLKRELEAYKREVDKIGVRLFNINETYRQQSLVLGLVEMKDDIDKLRLAYP
jgi:hypothetical protein